jgi:UDPglucose--hexose-1-phosphate uridylyltransferase
LYDKEVLFAPNRLKRKVFEPMIQNQKSDFCAFDGGNEAQTPDEVARVERGGKWSARIVVNLYNALSVEDENKSFKDGFNEKSSGFGAHEVVIETPVHKRDFFDFGKEEFEDYFLVLQKRVVSLQKDMRLGYIKIFKNHGFKAGASMEHSHSQIIAAAHARNADAAFESRQKEYFQKHRRTLLNDVIYEESQTKERVIYENERFFVYAPYASSFGFEVIVAAKNKESLRALDKDEINSLAAIFEKLFGSYKNCLGRFDFNVEFNAQTIASQEYTNFFIRIIPRLSVVAGYEIASGTFINPFMPETVAKRMREF